MIKTLLLVSAILLALTVPALAQSHGRLSKPENTSEKLIAMSRQYVAHQTAAVVATDAGLQSTPSGPMDALVVEARGAGQLESPVVSIKDDEAVVTGRVVFQGLPRSPRNHQTPVTIWFIKDNGRWKCVNLCLGDCGFN